MSKTLTIAVVAALGSAAQADVFRFDFGPASGNGVTTTSPDAFGNSWNNVTGPVTEDIVNIDNDASSLRLQFTSDFSTNGGANFGGLLTPDQALLGELAVSSATGDYVFGAGGFVTSFELQGLDTSLEYTLRFFGTRATGENRVTEYTAVGGNGTQTAQLQTSGTGAGTGSNGNNDDIAEIAGLTADANGEIAISFTRITGGFSYLGAFEVVAVPAPGAVALFGAAGLVAVRRRR